MTDVGGFSRHRLLASSDLGFTFPSESKVASTATLFFSVVILKPYTDCHVCTSLQQALRRSATAAKLHSTPVETKMLRRSSNSGLKPARASEANH